MPSTCYTDSKVALYWIKGESQEWRQFVQNRVNEIQTLVPAQHWKHCLGHDNPADLPSRGISLPDLLKESVWFSGPSWLSSSVQAFSCEEEWMPDECTLEMKKSAQHLSHGVMPVLLVGGEIGTVIQCQRFSTLGRLLRVTAYVLKFITRPEVQYLQVYQRRTSLMPKNSGSSHHKLYYFKMQSFKCGRLSLGCTVTTIFGGVEAG